MNKFKLYRMAKAEYAYSLFKNDRCFEKVRAIIIKDGKLLLVHKIKSNKYTLPGGGVDNGENIEIAVQRECYEEANAKVRYKKVVGILNYDVDMKFDAENFVSKRIEYYCLCDFLGFVKKKKHYGLNGEFFEKVEVVWQPIEHLDKCELSDYLIRKIETILKSNNNNVNKQKNKAKVVINKNKFAKKFGKHKTIKNPKPNQVDKKSNKQNIKIVKDTNLCKIKIINKNQTLIGTKTNQTSQIK